MRPLYDVFMTRPRRCFARLGQAAGLVLVLASAPPAFAQTAAPTELDVVVIGTLPGFRAEDTPRYLADQMNRAGIPDFTFTASQAANGWSRIEWRIVQGAYAGGGMRQFIPIPSEQRLFGNRHYVSVEMRLYLGGDYQTLTFGQAIFQGGPQDLELAAFVTNITRNLLGKSGAYRAIDIGPVKARP
jgi:hypothetical protein